MTIFNPMMWKNDEGLYFYASGPFTSNDIYYGTYDTSSRGYWCDTISTNYLSDVKTISGAEIDTVLADITYTQTSRRGGYYITFTMDEYNVTDRDISQYVSTNINGVINANICILYKNINMAGYCAAFDSINLTCSNKTVMLPTGRYQSISYFIPYTGNKEILEVYITGINSITFT